MARTGNGTSTSMTVASVPTTALPLTFFARARFSAFPNNPHLLSMTTVGADTAWWTLTPVASGGMRALHSDGTTTGTATTLATVAVGPWYACCAVFASTASRSVYVDGTSKNTDTTAVALTMAGVGQINVGLYRGGADANWLQGDICDVAIWTAALTDAEVAALTTQAPVLVRPESLVAYWPLVSGQSPEPDVIGSRPLTLANSPAFSSAAPPIVYPRGPLVSSGRRPQRRSRMVGPSFRSVSQLAVLDGR